MKTFQNFRSDAQLHEARLNEIQEPEEALQSGMDEAEEECPHCGNMKKEGEPCHCWQSGHHNELDEDGGGGGGAGAGGAGGGSGASGGAPGAGNGSGAGECTCTGTTVAAPSCPVHGTATGFYGDPSGDDYKKKKKYEEAPTNNAGSGNIAGLGVGPQGEPGVDPEYQRARKQLKLMNGPAVDPRMFRAKIFGRKPPVM